MVGGEYEFLYPKVIQGKILDAHDIMVYLNNNNFQPDAVSVDNTNSVLIIYFKHALDDDTKEKLVEAVNEYFKVVSR
jgi:hypothetical protein